MTFILVLKSVQSMIDTKMSITDEIILDKIRVPSNRDQGFKLLVSKYQEKLYWHIRRMVEYHEDAHDVIQNTFIKIHKSIDRFEGKSLLYTWMYRIATNESITFLNKRNKGKSTSIDDELNSLENKLEADSYFDGNEAQLTLTKAIYTLPEKQKAVFNLRYFENMSYRDMSEVFGTSEGALKASYHHAVKKIEAYILNKQH